MDWGIDFKFLLMNPSLLFSLLTICKYLVDVWVPGEVIWYVYAKVCCYWYCSECFIMYYVWVIYGWFWSGDVIISHLEGLKVICQDCAQSISLSRSGCRLFWSVIIDFSVKHCVVGIRLKCAVVLWEPWISGYLCVFIQSNNAYQKLPR